VSVAQFIYCEFKQFYTIITYRCCLSNYGSVWTDSAIDCAHCITEESLCSRKNDADRNSHEADVTTYVYEVMPIFQFISFHSK
jgi:hypothetical protein